MRQSRNRNASKRMSLAAFPMLVMLSALTMTALAAIPSGERQALINLYNSTNGDGWTDNSNWCGGTCPGAGIPSFNTVGSECLWQGITCNADQTHVIAVALPSNNLTGTLPNLSALISLQYFAVGSNRLSGSIPALVALTQLQTFYANNNQLIGFIPSLAALSALGDFSVEYNNLSGAVPSLPASLYAFAATENQLTGAIPDLSALASLRAFEVGHNQLSGPIPTLSGCPELLVFSVDHNQLTGSPPILSASGKLHHVDFGDNKLSGSLVSAPSSLYTPLTFSPSTLCANSFSTSPSSNDAGWNAATGFVPWWAVPYSSNACDDIFTDEFGM